MNINKYIIVCALFYFLLFGKTLATPSFAKNYKNPPSSTVTKEEQSYPLVSKLELVTFNQSYEHEDIAVRLGRLEAQIFGTQTPDLALSDRVDKLEIAILPRAQSNEDKYEVQKYTVESIMDGVEKQILGNVYPKDMLEDRVSRLEMKLFNKTSENDETGARIERILAVAKAMPGNENIAKQSKKNKIEQITVFAVTTGFIVLMFLL